MAVFPREAATLSSLNVSAIESTPCASVSFASRRYAWHKFTCTVLRGHQSNSSAVPRRFRVTTRSAVVSEGFSGQVRTPLINNLEPEWSESAPSPFATLPIGMAVQSLLKTGWRFCQQALRSTRVDFLPPEETSEDSSAAVGGFSFEDSCAPSARSPASRTLAPGLTASDTLRQYEHDVQRGMAWNFEKSCPRQKAAMDLQRGAVPSPMMKHYEVPVTASSPAGFEGGLKLASRRPCWHVLVAEEQGQKYFATDKRQEEVKMTRCLEEKLRIAASLLQVEYSLLHAPESLRALKRVSKERLQERCEEVLARGVTIVVNVKARANGSSTRCLSTICGWTVAKYDDFKKRHPRV